MKESYRNKWKNNAESYKNKVYLRVSAKESYKNKWKNNAECYRSEWVNLSGN